MCSSCPQQNTTESEDGSKTHMMTFLKSLSNMGKNHNQVQDLLDKLYSICPNLCSTVWLGIKFKKEKKPSKICGLKNSLTNCVAINHFIKVEVNPCWQQRKLRDFCKRNGAFVVGYSPLGSIGTFYGTNRVMESQVLKEIAKAKGKIVAQVALRWGCEQGIGVLVKIYNKERMKQNLEIFDWSLSDDDCRKISKIPQSRACLGKDYTSPNGPYKTIEEL
ncbi:Methylecgonone reductase [Capsicum baccatum]|uniref:Methylecgonone reductase n=1 Tax=Capsicum baccatum TaxID=33114 RepID=A0A2G2VM93_CAPBA|nr:Methylecgonone reductase [Capsicum baccatum]